MDDARGFGNGLLLPAGPLREPPRRLRSAHAVVSHQARLGGQNVQAFGMRLEGEVAHRMRAMRAIGSRCRPARGQRVHAVAGIGDPRRFFAHVGAGIRRSCPTPLPTITATYAAEFEFGDALPVLMTEKDAVKLRGHAHANWWVLPVTAQLDPAFGDWLLRTLDGRRRPKAA